MNILVMVCAGPGMVLKNKNIGNKTFFAANVCFGSATFDLDILWAVFGMCVVFCWVLACIMTSYENKTR